jgi:hypothetical protein
MRLTRHVVRLVVDTFRFAVARRQYSLVIIVVAALLLVALALAAQATAPVALYPFI